MSDQAPKPAWWRPGRHWIPHWSTWLILLVAAYFWWRPLAWVSDPMTPAPAISAQLLDGRTFDLNQHRGQVVLINVWAPWCPPCRREMPAMAEYYQANQDRPFTILALADDEEAAVRDFVRKQGIPFPVGLTRQASGLAALGDISRIPTSFIIDKQGRVVHRITGPLHPGRLHSLIDPLL
ncbi:TlpA disulfide reductase family protein [Thermithiobacillus plumbiphilus]|uniref:TlpA disulfide reductase family protein n=1 Tax=Thermithiobacillus plumbiphilus TaxID=1729899 RepID=A0ABU9D8S7_9PROT